MSFLSGEYDHKIDSDSNRISLKVELKKMLSDMGYEGSFYLTVGHRGVLNLYPEKVYEEFVFKGAPTNDGGQVSNDQILTYERFSFGLTTKCEIDKQGRLLIPNKFKRRAGLGCDVVIVAIIDHLEIWDPDCWETYLERQLELHDIQQGRARQAVFDEAKALNLRK